MELEETRRNVKEMKSEASLFSLQQLVAEEPTSPVVILRVRPFNKRFALSLLFRLFGSCLLILLNNHFVREKEAGQRSCVSMIDQETTLTDPQTGKSSVFLSDYAFSSDMTNRMVWDQLGDTLLKKALAGSSVVICGYGQTGSGKSFTTVGYGKDPGLFPNL
jgi:hypothetical protein